MTNRFCCFLLSVTVSLLSMTASGAEPGDSGIAKTFRSAATGEMQAALLQLEEEDYPTRQKALEKIKAIIAGEIITLASVNDDASRTSLLPVLTYNDGLIRWLEGVLALPEKQQELQIQLARSPKVMTVISNLFNRLTSVRIEAIHELAKFDKLEIDSLLGRLISEENREISLAAMEIAWDRKPTPLVVGALWYKAVEAGMVESQSRSGKKATAPLEFLGRPVKGPGVVILNVSDVHDSDIAPEVLMHINATLVSAPLSHFFSECASRVKRDGLPKAEWIHVSSNDANMRNAFLLAEYFKVREALPSLYALATFNRVGTSTQMDGQGKYLTSNRTAAAAVFLILTDQEHDAFQRRDFPNEELRNMWVTSNDGEEDKAIESIKAWWKEHSKEFPST